MVMSSLHWKTWLFLSCPPVFLAYAYIWGFVFRQTELNGLGFQSELYPLGVQEIYMETLASTVGVLGRTAKAINAPLFPSILSSVAIILGIVSAVSVAAAFYERSPLEKKYKRWRLAHQMKIDSSSSTRAEARATRWLAIMSLVPVSLLLLLFASMVLALAIIEPPVESAKAEVQDIMASRSYEKWPVITWMGDGGRVNTGFLRTCSERWCAAFQGDHAVDVPLTLVKRIDGKSQLRVEGPPAELLSLDARPR